GRTGAMIGKIRIVLALGFIAVSTMILAPLQFLAMKTGLWPETFILKIWHRAMLSGLGIRVRAVGTLSQRRPLLVAANHISWTDIMVLGSLVDVKFIAKSELEGWPLLGGLSKLQRTVFIERERKRKSGDQASEIATRLGKGDAMVLFAEGSTVTAIYCCRSRARCSGLLRWRSPRARRRRCSSSRWQSPIPACMAWRSAVRTG